MCSIKLELKIGSIRHYSVNRKKRCDEYRNSMVDPTMLSDEEWGSIYLAHSPVPPTVEERANDGWHKWLGARPQFDKQLRPITDTILFGTFTFKNTPLGISNSIPPTIGHSRRMLSRYIDEVLSAVPAVEKMFFVEEYGSVNNRLHYHGMFNLPAGGYMGSMSELISVIGGLWNHGYFKLEVERYTSGYYVAKYITKDNGNQPIFYADRSKKWSDSGTRMSPMWEHRATKELPNVWQTYWKEHMDTITDSMDSIEMKPLNS